mgnify:CR=1 FL=1
MESEDRRAWQFSERPDDRIARAYTFRGQVDTAARLNAFETTLADGPVNSLSYRDVSVPNASRKVSTAASDSALISALVSSGRALHRRALK